MQHLLKMVIMLELAFSNKNINGGHCYKNTAIYPCQNDLFLMYSRDQNIIRNNVPIRGRVNKLASSIWHPVKISAQPQHLYMPVMDTSFELGSSSSTLEHTSTKKRNGKTRGSLKEGSKKVTGKRKRSAAGVSQIDALKAKAIGDEASHSENAKRRVVTQFI
jgi:hypothetical protein